MRISGELALAVEQEQFFQAVHDVAVLRETVPGCERLEQAAPDLYTGRAKIGFAVVKGTYDGSVRILEERAPEYVRVRVEAKSGHAQISGEGDVQIVANGQGTLIRYQGDAQVRGPLAAVGQRLLPSASKSYIEDFLRNIEKKLRQNAPSQT